MKRLRLQAPTWSAQMAGVSDTALCSAFFPSRWKQTPRWPDCAHPCFVGMGAPDLMLASLGLCLQSTSEGSSVQVPKCKRQHRYLLYESFSTKIASPHRVSAARQLLAARKRPSPVATPLWSEAGTRSSSHSARVDERGAVCQMLLIAGVRLAWPNPVL